MLLRMLRFTVIGAMLLSVFVAAEDKTNVAKVDFNRIIKPMLESSCVKCHGADRWHGDLRIDTKELAMQSFGELGRLITPGKPDKSTLYTTTTLAEDDPNIMPPRDRDSLTAAQRESLRLWIEQGANWPEDVTLKRIDKVFFISVASIFQRTCLSCHSSKKAEGELRLDNRKSALKGGKNGAVIIPYDPDVSKFCKSLISPSVHDKNPPRLLFDEDIATLREWIRQGAVWPDDMEQIGPDDKK